VCVCASALINCINSSDTRIHTQYTEMKAFKAENGYYKGDSKSLSGLATCTDSSAVTTELPFQMSCEQFGVIFYSVPWLVCVYVCVCVCPLCYAYTWMHTYSRIPMHIHTSGSKGKRQHRHFSRANVWQVLSEFTYDQPEAE
jgi:hypothetical protein